MSLSLGSRSTRLFVVLAAFFAANAIIAEIVAVNNLPAKVSATTDRRAALSGARYIMSCVRVGGLEAFATDISIPLKYGVDQCVGDTICGKFVARKERLRLIIKRGGRHLVLVARTTEVAKIAPQLARWQALGASVLLRSCDVAQQPRVMALFDQHLIQPALRNPDLARPQLNLRWADRLPYYRLKLSMRFGRR